MSGALRRYLEAAAEVTATTRARAERLAERLVTSGEGGRAQVHELVEDLLARQERNRAAISRLVRTETARAMRAMGVATGAEVERLRTEVAALTRRLAAAEQAAGSSTGAPRRPAAGRSAPVKKAAAGKAPVKKAAAGKAPVKKAAAGVAPAKAGAAKGSAATPAPRPARRPGAGTS